MQADPNLPDVETAPSLEEFARDTARLLSTRLAPMNVLKLMQIVFLEVDEAADLLRVKPKTISTWISQGRIPVRYAGGKPVFLLAELLNWTLPKDDHHRSDRLSTVRSCTIALHRLAANREKENSR